MSGRDITTITKEAFVESPDRIRIEQHGSVGMLWIAAWLFSIGFLHLSFWRGVLALVIWPFYLGEALRSLVPQ
jgi:hypothetical protein